MWPLNARVIVIKLINLIGVLALSKHLNIDKGDGGLLSERAAVAITD